MRATKRKSLGEMAAKLLATARKLPPGPDRSNILQEIGRFRSQIISLQDVGLRPTRRGLKRRGSDRRELSGKWHPPSLADWETGRCAKRPRPRPSLRR